MRGTYSILCILACVRGAAAASGRAGCFGVAAAAFGSYLTGLDVVARAAGGSFRALWRWPVHLGVCQAHLLVIAAVNPEQTAAETQHESLFRKEVALRLPDMYRSVRSPGKSHFLRYSVDQKWNPRWHRGSPQKKCSWVCTEAPGVFTTP